MSYNQNDYLDIMDLESKYSSQHIDLSKATVGLESAVALTNYVDSCEVKEMPVSVDLLRMQARTIYELTGVDREVYDITEGVESFGDSIVRLIKGIFDVISSIISSIVDTLAKIVEKIVKFFKELISDEKKDKETTSEKLTKVYEETKAKVVAETNNAREHGKDFSKPLDSTLEILEKEIKEILAVNPMIIYGKEKHSGNRYIENDDINLSTINSYLTDFKNGLENMVHVSMDLLSEKILNKVIFNTDKDDDTVAGAIIGYLGVITSIDIKSTPEVIASISKRAMEDYLSTYNSKMDLSTEKLIEIYINFKEVLYSNFKDRVLYSDSLGDKLTPFLKDKYPNEVNNSNDWIAVSSNPVEIFIIIASQKIDLETFTKEISEIVEFIYGSVKGFDGSTDMVKALDNLRTSAVGGKHFDGKNPKEIFTKYASFIKLIASVGDIKIVPVKIFDLLDSNINDDISRLTIFKDNSNGDINSIITEVGVGYKEVSDGISSMINEYKAYHDKVIRLLKQQESDIKKIKKDFSEVSKTDFLDSITIITNTLTTVMSNRTSNHKAITGFMNDSLKVINNKSDFSIYKLMEKLTKYKATIGVKDTLTNNS